MTKKHGKNKKVAGAGIAVGVFLGGTVLAYAISQQFLSKEVLCMLMARAR